MSSRLCIVLRSEPKHRTLKTEHRKLITDMPLILEGIVTTRNEDDSINVSPMGPLVDRELTSFCFRPFQTSRTYQNLLRERAGIFHIVDDVLLLARAAINEFDRVPEFLSPEVVSGAVLEDACRWFEFQVVSIDDSEPRTAIETRIVHTGELRPCWGFNRAKHAVLELAVLSTRLFLMSRQEAESELERLAVIIEKTAGDQEQTAFDLLHRYITDYDGWRSE